MLRAEGLPVPQRLGRLIRVNEELTREHRLAVYGTLTPGQPNEHIMADIPGTWTRAIVRGTRVESGWGAAFGYPGITLDDAGDVECLLFESAQLPQHWRRVDEFEGDGYDRVPVQIRLAEGPAAGDVTEAYIYALSGR